MPIKKIQTLTSYCLSLALTFCVLALPTPTRAEGATTTTVPISTEFFVPCAGETVTLSGTVLINSHFTQDANGGAHGHFISPSTALRGVGLTSGQQYVGHSRTISIANSSSEGFPLNNSFIQVFRVNGAGPGNDYSLRIQIHVTLNANGELTANVFRIEFVCD